MKIAFLLLCFIPHFLYSQVLKGKALNEKGTAAIGVTVRFGSKHKAVTTDFDGNFTVSTDHLPDTLFFSGAGYEPYKVVITEKSIKDPAFEVVLLVKRKLRSEEVSATPNTLKKSGLYDVDRDGVTDRLDDDYTVNDKLLFFPDSNIASNREGILAKSRILTAGEVNDLNKWKMWEDFKETELHQWSALWGMKINGRYCVQVTNKEFHAVIGQKVFLIRAGTRDTLWKACTDNTGKAELWSGFLAEDVQKSNLIIVDNDGNTLSDPVLFANGINLLVIDKPCHVSADVEIAFVVDATGSMGDEIEFLKLELEDVVHNTLEKYPSLSLQAAAVFYRDKGDEYLARKTGFDDNLLRALNFIKLQRAQAGGDYPEAVDVALSLALDSLHWSNDTRSKLLFLILDAPPHEVAKTRIQQLTLKAAAMGVRIIPIACSGTDKSTEFLLRCMALATNGTYTFLTNQSGTGLPHIEPTTDKYQVELLNSLLQKIIGQFFYAKDCTDNEEVQLDDMLPRNILSLKIYPNPSAGKFTIESKEEITEMFISDFTGKILMRLGIADKKGLRQVNISAYPSGTYLVRYITKNNKWGAEKIILLR